MHGDTARHDTDGRVVALTGNRPVQGPSKVPAVSCGQSTATVATNEAVVPTIGSPS